MSSQLDASLHYLHSQSFRKQLVQAQDHQVQNLSPSLVNRFQGQNRPLENSQLYNPHLLGTFPRVNELALDHL